ncbi:MAG: metallophosphoesterase family protein [Planctomycetota bacterium]
MKSIISDIHSNLEALQSVLKDIEKQGITEIICLGDIVGYGPNPNECLDLILGKCSKIVIMGNHDEALMQPVVGFGHKARQAIEWTRTLLEPGWLSPRVKKNRWKFLKNLPLTKQDNGILCVHGSPRNPTTEYILPSDTETVMGERSAKLDEIFNMFQHFCFVGHSHYAGIITEEQKFLTPVNLNYAYNIKPNEKLIVNVGSVGQPRDGDNRSCYVTFDEKTINYHRVEYDFKTTQKKIYEIPELDHWFGERLEKGQ